MPLANTYSVGKITVTKNSVNFTGTGTLWKTAGLRDGDFVILNDMIGIIQGENTFGQPITSNTSGKLKRPWQGASGTYDYDMVFRSVDSRLTDNTQQVLEAIASGLLQSFGAVAAGKNKMPFFTGVNSVGVTELTEWARTLLAAANGAGGYTALGEIPNERLPARLREISTYADNCNDIVTNGFFRVSDAALNIPAGGAATILSLRYSATGGYQKWFSAINMKSYERRQAGGNWTPWVDTDFNASRSASSGFVAIPTAAGNLILQFGTVSTSVDAGGLGTFSLPISYPTAQITATLSSGNYNAEPGTIAPRTGAGDLKPSAIDFRSTRTSTNVRVNYFSMGY